MNEYIIELQNIVGHIQLIMDRLEGEVSELIDRVDSLEYLDERIIDLEVGYHRLIDDINEVGRVFEGCR